MSVKYKKKNELVPNPRCEGCLKQCLYNSAYMTQGNADYKPEGLRECNSEKT